MYFYIKINCLVVFGPKSYFLRGLWSKNLKKGLKTHFHSWKQNMDILVQKLNIVIISCLYRLAKKLRRCRMKDCFVPVKKKSTMFVLPKNTKFVTTKIFVFLFQFFRSLVQTTWDLTVKGLKIDCNCQQ